MENALVLGAAALSAAWLVRKLVQGLKGEGPACSGGCAGCPFRTGACVESFQTPNETGKGGLVRP